MILTRTHLSPVEQEALDVFVRRLYAHYSSSVRQVVLFGSKARGDFDPDSDVDILVQLSDDDPSLQSEVRRLGARVSLEYDLLLSIRAVGRSQWERMARYRSPLYRALQAEGIALTPQVA
jgi:predicted nucleotidyltransferase